MSRGGRDQPGPIERLVRVLAVLAGAGSVGATQEQLLLNRDIKYVNEAGWDIQNVADGGTTAR